MALDLQPRGARHQRFGFRREFAAALAERQIETPGGIAYDQIQLAAPFQSTAIGRVQIFSISSFSSSIGMMSGLWSVPFKTLAGLNLPPASPQSTWNNPAIGPSPSIPSHLEDELGMVRCDFQKNVGWSCQFYHRRAARKPKPAILNAQNREIASGHPEIVWGSGT